MGWPDGVQNRRELLSEDNQKKYFRPYRDYSGRRRKAGDEVF
jgi:hypothetical protein